MLDVGRDSYITVADADEYIRKYYRSTSKSSKRWIAINEPDKEALLRQACTTLDALPFPGRKTLVEQALAWPRLPQQYGMQQVPPVAIVHAQVEIALSLSDEESIEGSEKRQQLQAEGVTSFGIGDLSESYDIRQRQSLSWCPKALTLLKPYLGGGFEMR